MDGEVRIFPDTSVLFAAVLSESGGARLVLSLGEAQAIHVYVGPQVLREADGVLARKAPDSRVRFALLLDRARVHVVPEPGAEALAQATALIPYAPDARVAAEAITAGVDYFVTLDKQHFVGNPRIGRLPFVVGTPGDFLAWFRNRLRGIVP